MTKDHQQGSAHVRFSRRQLLTATLHGLACAGVATLLTALVSWSFVGAQPLPW